MHRCSPKCMYFPSIKQPVEHRVTLSGIKKTNLKFYCNLTDYQIRNWQECPYYKEVKKHDYNKRKILRNNKKNAKNG